MKERYIDLMGRMLSAYTEEHISHYFEKVRANGLTEHGFPRLTACIGILIAHGRVSHLKPIFLEMMEFCCKTIPYVKAGNDFSVREILECIRELSEREAVDRADIKRWRGYFSEIVPEVTYSVYAKKPTDKVNNWALFTAVSEFYRQSAGLAESWDFIDLQISTQLRRMDANGMYMDGKKDTDHPMLYDAMSRCLFALLLNKGYRGRYLEQIDGHLRRSGLFMLKMLSPNGELPFGGRSNQFVFNEAIVAALCEYEAKRYLGEGNALLARAFKAAAARALSVIDEWSSREPIYHVKNRFPLETKHGCENYAYFDKYMITAASNLYAAYSICDDSVEICDEPDVMPASFETTSHFHKLFIKSGGYGLEFDTDPDPHYDASGLGRVHRVGAPSAIAISVPCAKEPNYVTAIKNSDPISFCTGVKISGEWRFATDAEAKYEVLGHGVDGKTAYADIRTVFQNGDTVTAKYTVDESGVNISVTYDGEVAFMLPAFLYDGEHYTSVEATDSSVEISYRGWSARYITDGRVFDTEALSSNRNGYYKAYFATAKDRLNVKIAISRPVG